MDDPDVNELVYDISHDCVIHGFWDVTEEPPATTNIKRPATGVESNGSKVNYNTSTHLFLVKCNTAYCIILF